MQALSDSLQPYKEIVGQVASIVTIGQFFSGVFMCKDIYKKGTTKGTPSGPFVGGFIIGLLMLKYGLLLNDPAMTQVNVAALFLNVLYISFYYSYSPEKYKEVIKPLSIGFGIAAVILGYAHVEDPANLEYRYGMIMTILMFLFLALPLMDLKEIIGKRDASGIPFPPTFMATIVTFLWLLYGIILLNNFMIFQNIVGFSLCAVQLVLILVFPGEGQSTTKEKIVKKD